MLQVPHDRFTYLWEDGTYHQLISGGFASIDETLSFYLLQKRLVSVTLEEEFVRVVVVFTRKKPPRKVAYRRGNH